MRLRRVMGIFILFSLFQASAYAIERDQGRALIEKALAQQQINADNFFSRSVSFITGYLGAFEHEGEFYVFLSGGGNSVRDNYFAEAADLPSSAYLDTGFGIKPYLLVKMSKEDVEYLFSSINRDSELFEISSRIRSKREFVDHVDRIIISLPKKEDNVKVVRHQLSKELEASGFVKDLVTRTLKSMRIQDFEVFTYTIASLTVSHHDQETLSSWNNFFTTKLEKLE
ncbi:MAG: hypothetical protein K9L68_12375 [Spirochaetales bacterium]|nr:hypothetical protein [Spirochaetales bacterium]